jgi:DNA-binding HxlR family transcriptional regulator
LLYSTPTASLQESRRRSAAISRKLRLLRAHHLIRKVSSSYRYQLTPLGRQIITAVLAAGNAPINCFMAKAA